MGFLKRLFGVPEKKKTDVIKRTPMNIKVGDIVIYYEIDYEVLAVIDWVDDGFMWKEYKFQQTPKETCWLSAEVDDGSIGLVFYTLVKDFPYQNNFPKELTYNGKKYFLEEKGTASGSLTSRAGIQSYKCDYQDYISEDETSYLSIEDYGGELEISTGISIRESELNILPGE